MAGREPPRCTLSPGRKHRVETAALSSSCVCRLSPALPRFARASMRLVLNCIGAACLRCHVSSSFPLQSSIELHLLLLLGRLALHPVDRGKKEMDSRLVGALLHRHL